MNNSMVILLEGLNLTRLFDTLKNKNIVVYNIEKYAKCKIKIEILSKNYAKFAKLCNFYQISYTVIEDKSNVNLLQKLVKRIGLLLGFVVSFVFVYFSANVLWSVEVFIDNDEDGTYCAVVEDFLSQKGIKVGVKTSDIYSAEIERLLQSSMEDISSVIVQKTGTKLTVSAKKIVTQDKNSYVDIVASCDGVVESVKVYAGKCNVKVGDVVKKGDVLVALENGVCKADIYVKTWIQKSDSLILDGIKFERTGKKQVKNSVCFLGREMIKSGEDCKFEYYDMEEDNEFLCDNLFLPIVIKNVTFYELVQNSYKIDLESAKKTLKESLINEFLLENNVEIENVKCAYFESDNLVKCVISCEIVNKM